MSVVNALALNSSTAVFAAKLLPKAVFNALFSLFKSVVNCSVKPSLVTTSAVFAKPASANAFLTALFSADNFADKLPAVNAFDSNVLVRVVKSDTAPVVA